MARYMHLSAQGIALCAFISSSCAAAAGDAGPYGPPSSARLMDIVESHSAVVETDDQAMIHMASTQVPPSTNFDAFLAALRHMESRNDYRAVNTLNYLGAYQFGEAALVDLGYVRIDKDLYDNNYSGGFTGKHGIRSVDDFLSSPRTQDKAVRAWMKLIWGYIEAEGLRKYAWRDVGDVTLTPSGMLAATHLLGTGALTQFVRSSGRADIRDPYGMPLRHYIEKLGGFDIPFAPKRQKSASLDRSRT